MHLLMQVGLAAGADAATAPAAQSVLTYPAAYFAAQQPSNAADMVARLPGFSLDAGAAVRGFEGAAGNLLIDGQRPSSKADSLEEILRRIPADQVERIDVIRGGAPGIDMQGKSVLANVVRTKTAGVRALVAASQAHAADGRTAADARLEASGVSGARKWEAAAFLGKALDGDDGAGHGVRITRDPATGITVTPTRVGSERDRYNGFVTGAFETPLLGGAARINGRIFQEKAKLQEDVADLPRRSDPQSLDEVRTARDAEVGGAFTRALSARTSAELVGLRQTRDRGVLSLRTDRRRFTFDLDRKSSEAIGRAVLKHRFNDRLSFEAGGETARNQLDSRTDFSIDGQSQSLPAANVQVEERRSEFFMKAAWRPRGSWTFDAGVRYETSTITSEGDVELEKSLRFLKPRLTVSWTPAPSTQLRLRLEREVGQLSFDDFVATSRFNGAAGVAAGNPDLDPEQAWVAEAALEQRLWDSGVAVLTFRQRSLENVIDRGPLFAPNGDIFDRPTNIGKGTRRDLSLDVTLPIDRLGLTGAQFKGFVAKRWTKVTDPTTSESREISDVRPFVWSAGFVHDIPAWRLSYGLDAQGGWRETSYRFDVTETVKVRTNVLVFLEWRPAGDVNIRFELPNVTARGVRRTVSTFDAPRRPGAAPIAVEDKEYQNGRAVYVRVRKSFG